MYYSKIIYFIFSFQKKRENLNNLHKDLCKSTSTHVHTCIKIIILDVCLQIATVGKGESKLQQYMHLFICRYDVCLSLNNTYINACLHYHT